MQALLLRFLENGEIQSVGSDRRLTTVNVRVIAATNRNLPDLIAAGQFREDLLYRLRVIHLEVPPLRNRTEEIPTIISHFVARTHRRVTFTEEAMGALARYRWPGNVRELQNVVEQATWPARGEVVDVAQLPEGVRTSARCAGHAREAGTGRRRVVRWRKGLSTTRGNYRALLKPFRMSNQDYKRFLNFLAAHDCGADFRAFRHGSAEAQRPPRLILPPLPPKAALPSQSKLASTG